MKIRNGFVSNSSSSSFIIEQDTGYREDGAWGDLYTPNDVKSELIESLKKWQKSKIKNVRREVMNDKYITDKERFIKSQKSYYERNTYSKDETDKYLDVKYVKDAKDDLDLAYWYAGRVLRDNDIVIFDNIDNYIPEYACYKIIKKYNIDDNRYCLHMG